MSLQNIFREISGIYFRLRQKCILTLGPSKFSAKDGLIHQTIDTEWPLTKYVALNDVLNLLSVWLMSPPLVILKSRAAVNKARKVTWLSPRSQYGSVYPTLRHIRHTWHLIDSCVVLLDFKVIQPLIDIRRYSMNGRLLFWFQRQLVPLFGRRQRRSESYYNSRHVHVANLNEVLINPLNFSSN